MSSLSPASQKPVYKVALLLFSGADILDYAGPAEILNHARYDRDFFSTTSVFEVITVATDNSVSTSTGDGVLSIIAAISIEQALARISEFSVLVVPGGSPVTIQSMIGSPSIEACPDVKLIKAFASLESPSPSDPTQERVLLSVCTGAWFLGAAGALHQIRCTTHHQGLEGLAEICKSFDKPPIEIVKPTTTSQQSRKDVTALRYVDAGIVRPNLRIITAGGVSSGLDASLRVIDVFMKRHDAISAGDATEYGADSPADTPAEFVARLVEYERRQVGQ